MIRLPSCAILLSICLASIALTNRDIQANGVRVWTDASGAHSVEAELLGYRHGVVMLRKTDGAPVRLRLEQLSTADQVFTLQANELQVLLGRVVAVTDGDTVKVLDSANQQHTIRLDGIDAPESGQDFGTQSKKYLSSLIFGKNVRVEWKEKDRYGRTLGSIFVGGVAANLAMVRDGWAWHYKQYSDDETLARGEMDARARRVGLWRDPNPAPPWDYRSSPRTSSSPVVDSVQRASPTVQQSREATVYVTKSGTKYHRPNCRHVAKSKIPIDLAGAKSRYEPCSVCKPPR